MHLVGFIIRIHDETFGFPSKGLTVATGQMAGMFIKSIGM